MTYRTLMLNLDPHGDNRAVLAVGADLARRFGASVIGIAVCRPPLPPADAGMYGGSIMLAEVVELDRSAMEGTLADCEKQFRAAMKDSAQEVDWRGTITLDPAVGHIAAQCRAADLIVTAPTPDLSLLSDDGSVNVGALAMRAGRPILVVPHRVRQLKLDHVLAAWKDSREARRALVDALPLLLEAQAAVVLGIAGQDELNAVQRGVDDVARWLARHGVHALPEAIPAGTDDISALSEEIHARKPDVIVAGAYGHSRAKEWVFGGITRDILLYPGCCVLISH